MPAKGAFIDANLLVLLVVGGVDRQAIARHKRTRRFPPEDYDALLRLFGKLDRIYVTPNVLTETSNLLFDPSDTRFMEHLRRLIGQAEEVTVASEVAANNAMFAKLGLTDAALLEAISAETPLVTVDFDLYGAACAKGDGVAFNFTHYSAVGISPQP